MWPLLREGDRLWLERCDVDACAVGDVVVRSAGQDFFAHVLVARAPLRTTSLWGVPDDTSTPVVARALAFARGAGPAERVIPLNRAAIAAVLRLAPRAGPWLKQLPGLGALVTRLRPGQARRARAR